MQQQGIAFINVARGMQQQLLSEGYELRIGPLLEKSSLNLFGPKIARQMLVDRRRQQTVQPQIENEMLAEGFAVVVHKLDNDAEHLQAHMQLMQTSGDPHGNIRLHIQGHLTQMQAKQAAMQKALLPGAMGLPQGAPGVPGGGGRGVAGTPRQGAQPGVPRTQGPPGQIHRDRMPAAGGGSVVAMPRKM